MSSLTVRNLPEDAKRRFRQVAAAHGRSMEEHLRQLVINADFADAGGSPSGFAEARQTFQHDPNYNWVEELIRIANGANLRIPESRSFVRYAPDYPEGLEPQSGESLIQHISRISRPGIDLDADRDRTPHDGPEL